MKTVLRILLIVFLSGSDGSCAASWNQTATPAKVLQALDSLYPGEKNVSWSKRRHQYTADFIYKDMNVSVSFDKNGHMTGFLKEISMDLLPERIQEKIDLFYNSFKIMMIMERSFKGKTEYDVHVIQGKQHYILNYHPKGFLIHQYEVEKIDYAAQATN